MNKKDFAKAVQNGNYKRWREERGIKMVMSIVPFKKVKRATCEFEGVTYVVVGQTNTEALNAMFGLLKEKAKLNA